MNGPQINIGATVSKETANNVQRVIVAVLQAGYKSHADQETIRTALNACSKALKVENVTVANSKFVGDVTV